MADLPITALTTAGQLSSSDLLYVAIPNPLSPIGFSLCKMTSAQFGIFLNKDLLFASDLTTDNKNIIGAINELKAGGGGGGASVIQLTQAEYTALSTAEKMNGSIYKLTDKAIFYCLDEEYHPVKELTTAQYNVLTTAEKNNGTIYIQTDAETTGSDIPVSTGETETIAEAIGSVTTGQATLDTTKIDGGGITYTKVGKLVIVDVNVRFKANIAADSAICSGLPRGTFTHFLLGVSQNIYRTFFDGTTIKMSDVPPAAYCTGMFVYKAN